LKGSDIVAVLALRPDAEFAVVPGKTDTKIIRIRFVSAAEVAGQWTYDEQTDAMTGAWRPSIGHPFALLRSAEITSVEDAKRIVAERLDREDDRIAHVRRAQGAVDRLLLLGVSARRVGATVVVQPDDALDVVLAAAIPRRRG
jgi:hypothetical protein